MNKSKDKMKMIIIACVACVVAILVIAFAATSLSGGSVKAADGAVPAVRTSESVKAAESEAEKKAEEAKETEADTATSLKDQIDYDYLQNALAYIDMTYEKPEELKDEDYGEPALAGYLRTGLATRAGKDGRDYVEEPADDLPQIITDDQFQAIVDPNSDLTADYSYGYIDATYANTCFDKFIDLTGCKNFSVSAYLGDYYKGGSYSYDVTGYSRQLFSKVEMGNIEKDNNAVYVHYRYTPDVTDSESEDEFRVAVIVPAKNKLGYQINQITEDNGDVSYYVKDDKKNDDEDEETETDIYGNVIEKETEDEEETDIYGNVIEKETDIYGNVIDDDEDEDEDDEPADYNDGDYHSSTSSSSGSNSRNPFTEDSSSASGMIGFNGSLGQTNSNSDSSSDDDYYGYGYGYGYYGY